MHPAKELDWRESKGTYPDLICPGGRSATVMPLKLEISDRM